MSNYTPTPEQAQATAAKLISKWPSLAAGQRAQSAAVIAATPGAVDGCEIEGYTVRSQSNAAGAYRVRTDKKSCTCPDHGAHAAAGVVCKHRLAAYIWQQCQPKTARPLPVIEWGDHGTVIPFHGPARDRRITVRVSEVSNDEEPWFVLVAEGNGDGNYCFPYTDSDGFTRYHEWIGGTAAYLVESWHYEPLY